MVFEIEAILKDSFYLYPYLGARFCRRKCPPAFGGRIVVAKVQTGDNSLVHLDTLASWQGQ
jgi:hypothetical protein